MAGKRALEAIMARAARIMQTGNGELEWYERYAGRDDDGRSVLVADWNEPDERERWRTHAREVYAIGQALEALESEGVEGVPHLDWQDTTIGCECGALIITEPQHMWDVPQYLMGDGWIACSECAEADPIETVIRSAEAHCLEVAVDPFGLDWEEHGGIALPYRFGSYDQPRLPLPYDVQACDKEVRERIAPHCYVVRDCSDPRSSGQRWWAVPIYQD